MSPHSPRIIGVIPARLASTRLPRKVLRQMAGEPMLAWVYRAARQCTALDQVIVATDSLEVHQECSQRGWSCLMTSPELPSGTDRLHAVSRLVDADIYVNIQGDEPLLLPSHIHAILDLFTAPHIQVTTPKVRCSPGEISNPNSVKVVTALDGRALYFSRATIPFDREGSGGATYWKHLGLYAYRKAALERFASLRPSQLEISERLEQLRLLENGIDIHVAETEHDTIGVDTEDDLRRVEKILLERGSARS
ncbi:MAG: 3-deoxy-manno-octulosonate cytidylyltransferase [Acidobacteriota bacterium]